MEQLHLENARELEKIIESFGWPDAKKVGEQANEAAFLVAMHAISLPDFQRKCLQLIEAATERGVEPKSHYAYMADRICFNERMPQRFGTQYDWDADGRMTPWTIEEADDVNKRRAAHGLNPIEEETESVRKGVAEGNQPQPPDYESRQVEILEWSKRTGWIE